MPTGCTEILLNRRLSFKGYVIICGLGYYNKGPHLDVIPKEFKPSDSALLKIKMAKEQLEDIQGWDEERAEKEAEKAYQKEFEEWRKNRDKGSKNRQRIKTVLTRVREWKPPAGHEEIKSFIINKLEESLAFDFPDMPEPKRLTGVEYQQQQIARLKQEIKYHTEEYQKEIERTKFYNNLLRSLRESLK